MLDRLPGHHDQPGARQPAACCSGLTVFRTHKKTPHRGVFCRLLFFQQGRAFTALEGMGPGSSPGVTSSSVIPASPLSSSLSLSSRPPSREPFPTSAVILLFLSSRPPSRDPSLAAVFKPLHASSKSQKRARFYLPEFPGTRRRRWICSPLGLQCRIWQSRPACRRHPQC